MEVIVFFCFCFLCFFFESHCSSFLPAFRCSVVNLVIVIQWMGNDLEGGEKILMLVKMKESK